MTQEDKDLLLKVLCDGLPYGLVVEYKGKPYEILGYGCGRLSLVKKYESRIAACPLIEEVKPYLRPMSSMTDEEKEQTRDLWIGADTKTHAIRLIDFYNKNHFDFMGLIPKDLAIPVTEENNPYEPTN